MASSIFYFEARYQIVVKMKKSDRCARKYLTLLYIHVSLSSIELDN